ncbi:hypothetical protein JTB14_035348 [Gonioctena quinquepunctata]|nr:hypothetical protein JTB14_035348 [Gonioctena quinquepunctata]
MKISKGNLENEVAEYFRAFVDNTLKNITTREQLNSVKKLLAPVEPRLAAIKNNSELLPKAMKNNDSSKGASNCQKASFGERRKVTQSA